MRLEIKRLEQELGCDRTELKTDAPKKWKITMHYFEYKDQELYCQEVPLHTIAKQVGTPCYVYSSKTFERHYKIFEEAFSDRDHLICFSVKANSNLAVLKSLHSWGAGADIVSGGELYRTLRVGCPPEKIVFSGVGKRNHEIEPEVGTNESRYGDSGNC